MLQLRHEREGYFLATRHEFLILGLGALMASAIYAIFPITYFPDSDQYYSLGREILGEQTRNASDFRGLGLPLMMILSGVYWLTSFKVFVGMQLFLGVLMPLILYKLLCYWNKAYAFIISLLLIGSLVPFGYGKAILSEQAYMFVILVLIYNSIRLQQTEHIRFLYFQAILIFLLVAIKPIANLLFVVFLAYNVWLFRKRLKHVLLSFAICFTLSFISHQYTEYLFKSTEEGQRKQHMAGAILFYNLYLSSDIEGKKYDLGKIETFSALMKIIHSYYLKNDVEYAGKIEAGKSNPEAFKLLFRPYVNNPPGLSDAIIEKPTKYYYAFIYESANQILGNEKGDRLLLQASMEIMLEYPGLVFRYLTRNLVAFATGRHISYSYYVARDKRITEYYPPSLEPLTWPIQVSSGSLPAGMIDEVALGKINQDKRLSGTRDLVLVEIWGRLFLVLRPMVFLGMVLGVWFLRKDKHYILLLLCTTIVLYHMTIVCIFNVPLNRYVIPTLVPEVFCASVFAYVTWGKLKVRVNQSRPFFSYPVTI